MDYKSIPILHAARKCGLAINSRTLDRTEIEASCPFCGDKGAGKYHLGLNRNKDMYYCVLCGARGNSVTLYAKMNNVSNKEAYRELTGGDNVYKFPQESKRKITELQPASIQRRNAVYSAMLDSLILSDRHRRDLIKRGLSGTQIERNMYRSLPANSYGRRLLAEILSENFDLRNIPGFFTENGVWTCSGNGGLLIPIRDKNRLIQGFQVRIDDEKKPARKYFWFSSRERENGCRVQSWLHIAGNIQSRRAYLTEGAIKGDVASALFGDSLFICLAGVNSTKGLRETVIDLNVNEVAEVFDMDKLTNPNVAKARENIRKIIMSIPNVKYRSMTWDIRYKGIDDYAAAFLAA